MEKIRAKILLVEDDPNFGNVLKNYLQLQEYQVHLAADGEAGWKSFREQSFDLVLLDVMMPKLDGFSLAERIREQGSRTPIIFMTAKSMKEDILKGYRSGADDYLTKPFDSDVLLFKMNAILKRSLGLQELGDKENFNIGSFQFDYKLRKVRSGDEVYQLSPKEAELLRLLCLHENDVLPRQKALKLIWGDDNYFNGRSMDVFVTRLRKYFRADPSIEIVSLHGKGIRLLTSGVSDRE